jgi:hypothetical protein
VRVDDEVGCGGQEGNRRRRGEHSQHATGIFLGRLIRRSCWRSHSLRGGSHNEDRVFYICGEAVR